MPPSHAPLLIRVVLLYAQQDRSVWRRKARVLESDRWSKSRCPLTGLAPSSKILSLCTLLLPLPSKGDNKSAYFMWWLCELNEQMHKKHSEQSLVVNMSSVNVSYDCCYCLYYLCLAENTFTSPESSWVPSFNWLDSLKRLNVMINEVIFQPIRKKKCNRIYYWTKSYKIIKEIYNMAYKFHCKNKKCSNLDK